MRRAVEMRAEVRARLIDRPPVGQAEHLIAAAVGEDRLVPADEAMQAAAPRDQVVAGPQVQVIGVAEQHLRAEAVELPVRHALHRALRAYRHEGRRLDVAVGGRHPAPARARVGVRHLKSERHVLSLFAMKKLRVGVIYGGRSGEHEVSLASAASVFQNLDPARYDAVAIRIEKDGRWTLPPEPPKVMKAADVIKGAVPAVAARETHPMAFPGGDTLLTIDPSTRGGHDDARSGQVT